MHFILSILCVGIGHITFVTGINNISYKHVSRHVDAFLGYVIKPFNRATAQLASHWLLTGDVWVQFRTQDSPLGWWGQKMFQFCSLVVHP
jgi:hypothetical protein